MRANLRFSCAALFVLAVVGCGSKPPPEGPIPTTTGSAAPVAPGSGDLAKEGESCGDGTMGAPNRQCADGLVCDVGAGTAPTAPAGAESSAKPGTCKKK